MVDGSVRFASMASKYRILRGYLRWIFEKFDDPDQSLFRRILNDEWLSCSVSSKLFTVKRKTQRVTVTTCESENEAVTDTLYKSITSRLIDCDLPRLLFKVRTSGVHPPQHQEPTFPPTRIPFPFPLFPSSSFPFFLRPLTFFSFFSFFSPFSLLSFFFPYLLSLRLEVRPLESSYRVWGSVVSSLSGVWGGAPVEIEFGGF